MELLSYLPSFPLARGFATGWLALVATFAMEAWTPREEVNKLCETNGGRELYASAFRANLRNHGFMGPLVYYYCVTHWVEDPLPWPERIWKMTGLILLQGVLYYLIHTAFHEVKGLYWMHKYHHQFHETILPSAAAAVSVEEYLLAYLFPVTIGVPILQVDEFCFFWQIAVVALTNICIHSPFLERKYGLAHWSLVSTHDHFNHHRRNRGNYAAPIVHMDRLWARIRGSGSVLAKETSL